MTVEKMRELLSDDEKITIEYKECAHGVQKDVYETVSSFSNRYGGYIIMGVLDGGVPVGVHKNLVKDMKREFVNALNNPNVMSPTLYLSLEEMEYDGHILLWTYVPPTSVVEKCSGKIYDRNEDGDMDITDSPIQLQNMYNRKSNTYAEHKIFPYVKDEDLKLELMEKVKNLVKSKKPDHDWLSMTDRQIMISAGLYEKDFSSGLEGYNLAAVLLFGKDEVIKSCAPGYQTDALYRVENLDRYDDRITVRTNLIESYELLMEFIAKHTSDKFYLVDNINTSIRDLIAREVVANILIHRDYASAFPAKLIIEENWIRTENWCIPRKHGNLMSDEFTPYPKNPLLQGFFTNIGRADAIGSGVRNLYKYVPVYSDGGKPELFEDDVFRISIPLNKVASDETMMDKKLSDREQKIYDMICDNNHLTVEQVMAELDISRATVFRDYKKIRDLTGVSFDKNSGTWIFPR
ncbi:RNA-binding domain-containing protein [Butyrivibrio sp. INlla14]|uniref:RNA-binding domain-containing protein n=1 Tax=Butyrivibrio sp. INlla14 TaxID=1520808 RepID=UPI00087654E4|nr:RNA-binding domain-containing protein [Butyrivibrio sp. INlla14]SCY11244.1 ATP-dependent DNA helicase RecG [Butyrivibrio sp. INlla14]